MHQSFKNLPLRVIIDTNVLLNGCFLSSSSAHRSIVLLRNLGYSLVIDEAIHQEATSKLQRLRLQLGLTYDPIALFDQFLIREKVLLLPKSPLHRNKKINRADQKIYSAAIYYKTWILTGDIRLAKELHSIDFPTRLPWDVLMEEAMHGNKKPPIDYIIQCIGLSKNQGSIFARATPVTFSETTEDRVYTLCDIENVGRLVYESKNRSWAFLTKLGGDIRTSTCTKYHSNEEWIVCASYEISSSDICNVTLRVANKSSFSDHKSIQTKIKITAQHPGRIEFGRAIDGSDPWTSGYLKKIVVSPKSMKDLWGSLIKLPESAPDPMAGNVLEAALRSIRYVNGFIVTPSEKDICKIWI